MSSTPFFYFKRIKKQIITISLAVTLIAVILGTNISDSALGGIFEQFTPPDWSEVKDRNIVKNSIPITILETQGADCLVSAKNFNYIIEHNYFKRSQDLANELQYDKENETIIVSCDRIPNDTSKLDVWYATDEAIHHAEKYEYFITSIND